MQPQWFNYVYHTYIIVIVNFMDNGFLCCNFNFNSNNNCNSLKHLYLITLKPKLKFLQSSTLPEVQFAVKCCPCSQFIKIFIIHIYYRFIHDFYILSAQHLLHAVEGVYLHVSRGRGWLLQHYLHTHSIITFPSSIVEQSYKFVKVFSMVMRAEW